MALVCIVEDDASVRELIRCTVKSAGFETRTFESGEDFFAGFEELDAQLLLLDIMLPGMDGLEVFRRLKNMGSEIPAIFLTAKNTEIDKVTGLDLGAEDYIAKPFGVLELIARIKTAIRRGEKSVGTGKLVAGILKMDVPARQVTVADEKVTLTYKEFEMLRYFMMNVGIVLTRDRLLNEIWGIDADIETRTVDMHIKTLRKKIGSAGGHIKTVRGVGYEFEA